MASRIIARFPPPKRSDISFLDGRRSRREELLAEFAAHNAAYLAKQKERLKPFFDTVEKIRSPTIKWTAASAWTMRCKSWPRRDRARHRPWWRGSAMPFTKTW
jgi:hypothetical protein